MLNFFLVNILPTIVLKGGGSLNLVCGHCALWVIEVGKSTSFVHFTEELAAEVYIQRSFFFEKLSVVLKITRGEESLKISFAFVFFFCFPNALLCCFIFFGQTRVTPLVDLRH